MHAPTHAMPAVTSPLNGTARRMRSFARVGAALTMLLALCVLSGYALRIPALANLGASGAAMSAMTALAVLCLSVGVVQRSIDRPSTVFAGAAGAIAALALIGTLVQGDDVVSAFIANAVFAMPNAFFGRTSLSTAVAVLALALASQSGLDRRIRALPGFRLTDALSAIALVLSGLGLLGYFYRARLLMDAAPFSDMSLATAACLFVLSMSMLAAQPAHGWAATVASQRAGGSATRRQLVFTLIPPVVGWYLIGTVELGTLAPAGAMALLVALTIVPLALLVLRDGAVLDLLDVEKSRNADQQSRMNASLGEQLAMQAEQLRQQSQERLAAEMALSRTQRLEAVGQLTGGIAHDFNNLLMAVKGNLDLMRRRLPEGHETLLHITRASAAVAKGTKITQQLLAFSRTQKLEIRAMHVSNALADALELITRALGPDTSVTLHVEDDEIWAAADPDQFELALLNLAINSRDALRDGGRIRIRQSTRVVSVVDGAAPAERVVVSVTDNGTGMPPEVVARATEPFFTTKPHGQGTGLGLAQAYGFAKQCGGDLRISSVDGEGTTVEIWLPRVDPTRLEHATTIPRRFLATETPSRRVLVIDDDEAVRTAVVEGLRESGQHVVEAIDGRSGLLRLAESRPDVAVIDFIMPGMNGAEVGRAAQRLHPGLPIVFVSGYLDTLALDGITHAIVVRKPFELSALVDGIESVIADVA